VKFLKYFSNISRQKCHDILHHYWYHGVLYGHELPALTNNWTRGAATVITPP